MYGSNFIEQHSDTVTVWNYQIADCSLRKKVLVSFIIIFGTLSFPVYRGRSFEHRPSPLPLMLLLLLLLLKHGWSDVTRWPREAGEWGGEIRCRRPASDRALAYTLFQRLSEPATSLRLCLTVGPADVPECSRCAPVIFMQRPTTAKTDNFASGYVISGVVRRYFCFFLHLCSHNYVITV